MDVYFPTENKTFTGVIVLVLFQVAYTAALCLCILSITHYYNFQVEIGAATNWNFNIEIAHEA